jgi:hypothetical protein
MARPRFSEEQIAQLIAYYKQFGTVGDVIHASWTEGTVGWDLGQTPQQAGKRVGP